MQSFGMHMYKRESPRFVSFLILNVSICIVCTLNYLCDMGLPWQI